MDPINVLGRRINRQSAPKNVIPKQSANATNALPPIFLSVQVHPINNNEPIFKRQQMLTKSEWL